MLPSRYCDFSHCLAGIPYGPTARDGPQLGRSHHSPTEYQPLRVYFDPSPALLTVPDWAPGPLKAQTGSLSPKSVAEPLATPRLNETAPSRFNRPPRHTPSGQLPEIVAPQKIANVPPFNAILSRTNSIFQKAFAGFKDSKFIVARPVFLARPTLAPDFRRTSLGF